MSGPSYRGRFNRALRAFGKNALKKVVRTLSPQRQDLPLSTWRLARDAGGALLLDGFSLQGVLERWGSPVHVVDAVRLRANAAHFMARPRRASKACEVYFSYKTNPVSGLLHALHHMGAGAEVISPYELWLALSLGVAPKSIVYNGPAKSPASVVRAVERGVGLINVNSSEELDGVAQAARVARTRARVGIRVVTPGCLGGQLGERIDTGAALQAFRQALKFPELQVVALHSHYNAEISAAPQLDAYLKALLRFADTLRDALKLELEIIDVGGNLACPTVNSISPLAQRLALTFGVEPVPRAPESVLSIDAYVEQVLLTIEGHYHGMGRPAPRVFLEPGRALSGNAQLLLCRVAAVRGEDDMGMRWAVLDAGINVAEEVRGKQHQLFAVHDTGDVRLPYRVAGPSCMLGDLLYAAWRLPVLQPGSALAIMDTGAYFISYATCFSAPRPPVVLVDAQQETVLRRAESFDDLVVLDGPLPAVERLPVRRVHSPMPVAHALERA
ncbi:MAG: pyridoxal-dependent decarboxylase [Myxococcaceae bacterium]|nr:pyridoxal-dependent decarboxylase [Myxococcaceae bacterium]